MQTILRNNFKQRKQQQNSINTSQNKPSLANSIFAAKILFQKNGAHRKQKKHFALLINYKIKINI